LKYELAKYLGEGTEPGASGESPMLLLFYEGNFGRNRGLYFGHMKTSPMQRGWATKSQQKC